MKYFLLSFGMFVCSYCCAQISYEPLSYSDALTKSKAEGKLIFIQLESKDCNQCNEVADKGLSDASLAARVNETFIPIKVSATSADRAIIDSKYSMLKSFGILFVDHEGTLIHKMASSSTTALPYIKAIEEALNRGGETLKLSALEKEYNAGNRSPGFMETYLSKRLLLNLNNEALLDEYVKLLPADSLQSVRTLMFLARMAPLLESRADTALRKNLTLFNQAWYKMPLTVRSSINSRIIYRSMQKAISAKDERYALRTAAFAQRTHAPNSEGGTKSYDNNMLRFYKETGDTAQYFIKAIAYYDRYFMTVNPDTVKRRDSINMSRKLASGGFRDTVINGKATIYQTVSFAPAAQMFTKELTEGAAQFYKLTNNPYLLTVATTWAKRGLEFFTMPEALDTYAKLLYKQGQKATAMEKQTEAIALRKKRGFSTREYEIVLEKMKRDEKLD